MYFFVSPLENSMSFLCIQVNLSAAYYTYAVVLTKFFDIDGIFFAECPGKSLWIMQRALCVHVRLSVSGYRRISKISLEIKVRMTRNSLTVKFVKVY